MRIVSASAWSASPAWRRRSARSKRASRGWRGARCIVNGDDRPELALEFRQPALVRAAAPKLGSDCLEVGDQRVEQDRLARTGDDRRYRALVAATEPVDEQSFEKAQRDAAIDRAAGSNRDQQIVRPPGRARRALRGILDPRQPRLEFGDAIARPIGELRCRGARHRRPGPGPCRRSTARLAAGRSEGGLTPSSRRRLLRACQPPGGRRRARHDQRERNQDPGAPAQPASGSGRRHSPLFSHSARGKCQQGAVGRLGGDVEVPPLRPASLGGRLADRSDRNARAVRDDLGEAGTRARRVDQHDRARDRRGINPLDHPRAIDRHDGDRLSGCPSANAVLARQVKQPQAAEEVIEATRRGRPIQW